MDGLDIILIFLQINKFGYRMHLLSNFFCLNHSEIFMLASASHI